VQGKKKKKQKTLAPAGGGEMYRKEAKEQLGFEDFYLPFGGHLDEKNRWVKLASLIPWEEFEEEYAQKFSTNGMGAPAKSFRTALGAELIKRKLNITDEEVVNQIRENHYMQYFIGMESYREEAPFDASMLTYFRERLSLEMINRINDRVIENENKKKESSQESPSEILGEEEVKNKGKILLDATCVPQDIRYPTDLSLLNDVREKTEQIIDRLHDGNGKQGKKPRAYRRKAGKEYRSLAKQRNKKKKTLRKGLRKQLGYVRRNLKNIRKQVEKAGMKGLSAREQRNLVICHEVFRQQETMYLKGEQRIEDRIVSISQPHVRPIKRGKAGRETEFGSKLLISVVDGFVRIETLSWDNFNEGTMFIDALEAYKERYSCYPESAHADKIFVTKENRKYCKENGIRISGPPLGRPVKDAEKSRDVKKQEAQDAKDRIPVEGKIGNCKRKYGLDKIYAKKIETSECEIAIGILILNLDKLCRDKERKVKSRRVNIFVIFFIRQFPEKQFDGNRYFPSNILKIAA
jgi:uncharacterized protein YukE